MWFLFLHMPCKLAGPCTDVSEACRPVFLNFVCVSARQKARNVRPSVLREYTSTEHNVHIYSYWSIKTIGGVGKLRNSTEAEFLDVIGLTKGNGNGDLLF